MKRIDLNCDMGEGFGLDEALMPYITSANIACGFHAGDEDTIRKTLHLCKKYHVAAGAHPSFNDRENFGRTDMHISLQEIYELMMIQLKLIDHLAEESGMNIIHVKPHGALYNMAARSQNIAATIALSVKDFNENLIVYGLSGSHLVKEAEKIGLKAWNEAFADRLYNGDGSLTSRNKPGALIESAEKSLEQVEQMITKNSVISIDGTEVPILADTICIHGDGPFALSFAKNIFFRLTEIGLILDKKT